jgi:hypothetical protein
MPRQFGPTSLAPYVRMSASSSSCLTAPSRPVSAKPAEMTHNALTPRFSADSAAERTAVPGTQITARSTTSGMSSIDR